MNLKGFLVSTMLVLLLAGCATKRNTNWQTIEDPSKSKIYLTMPSLALNKTNTRFRGFGDSWLETGYWESGSKDLKIDIWINVYALYNNTVFSSGHYRDLGELVGELTGDGYLVLGKRDSYKTKTGIVDIQYYTISGLACFFVENYWLDGDTWSSDPLKSAGSEHIIGNSRLRANYCDENREILRLEDVENFLDGIYVKNVFWPNDRFTNVNFLDNGKDSYRGRHSNKNEASKTDQNHNNVQHQNKTEHLLIDR